MTTDWYSVCIWGAYKVTARACIEVMADGHTIVCFVFVCSFFFLRLLFNVLAVWLGCMAWLYGPWQWFRAYGGCTL